MSLTLSTNLSSIITQRSLKQSSISLNQAIERMTTGYKINHAKDNAANYSIATNLSSKISAYEIAESNASMGLDMVQTASGALSEIEDRLSRLRALATQAQNGTYGNRSLNAINAEANALVDEIERICGNSSYNGIDLMKAKNNDLTGIPLAEGSKFINAITKRDTSAMTTLASVDETVALADGTYSISTTEEMEKLSRMTSNGLISSGDEFVLANDIDMSGVNDWQPIGYYDVSDSDNKIMKYFYGSFDGNGYVIKNFHYNNSEKQSFALFGSIRTSTIKNVGMENVDVRASGGVAPLVSLAYSSSKIINCYATGDVTGYRGTTGGLVAEIYGGASIQDSYTNMNISGNVCGGILSYSQGSSIENCYSASDISSFNNLSGGILGSAPKNMSLINNCYVLGQSENLSGIFVGWGRYIQNSKITVTNSSYSSYYEGKPYCGDNLGNQSYTNISKLDVPQVENPKQLLQVGINSESSSVIELDMDLSLLNMNVFRSIGLKGNCLDLLDKYISMAADKQVKLGAAENRLTSALEAISINYENLVSSRSTIKDADIAEVSSEYIRNQILQQASATLMSTANQTPAIALRLL